MMEKAEYTPMIPGVSDVEIMPRRGVIRLGESMEEQNAAGKKYPEELDHLGRIDGAKEDAELYHKLYGEKPRAIRIVFASNGLTENFRQEFVSWNGKGQKTCYGNGSLGFERSIEMKPEIQAQLSKAKDEKEKNYLTKRLTPDDYDYHETPIACHGFECPKFRDKKCAIEATLKFYIIGLKGIGKLWWIKTGSKWSIKVINNVHEHIKSLTSTNGDPDFGRIRGIPLSLTREQKQFSLPTGIKPVKWVISIDAANFGIEDLLTQANPQLIAGNAQKAIEMLSAVEDIPEGATIDLPKTEVLEPETPAIEGENNNPEPDANPRGEKAIRQMNQLDKLAKAIGMTAEGLVAFAMETCGKDLAEMDAVEILSLKKEIQSRVAKDRDEFLSYITDIARLV